MTRVRAVARWAPLGMLVILVLGAIAVVAWRRYIADPSAGDLRDAIALSAPDACDGELSVRGIRGIGGPELPDGMVLAKKIVCDRPPNDALAAHYKFGSPDAARSWLRRHGRHLGDTDYGWTLNGSTLIGSGDLSRRGEWPAVLRQLGLSDGHAPRSDDAITVHPAYTPPPPPRVTGTRSCGSVRPPRSSSGTDFPVAIRATNIDCRVARRIAKLAQIDTDEFPLGFRCPDFFNNGELAKHCERGDQRASWTIEVR